MSSSWYTTGANVAKKARSKMQSSYRNDFWMKDGETAKLIFLDREPHNVYEHIVKLRGKTKHFTCIRKRCPLCNVDEARYFSVYRIVDMRSYKDKKGVVHRNNERYFLAGAKVAVRLERLEARGRLYKKVVEIERTGADQTTTYALTPGGTPKIDVPARSKLDFEKDFAPKSREELETLAELLGGAAAPDRGDDDEDDEDEPKKKKKRSYLADDDSGVEDDEDDTEDEDDEEAPPKRKKKRVADEDDDEEEGDDDEDEDADDAPPARKKKRRVVEDEDEEDDDESEDDDDEEDDDDPPRRKKKTAVKKKHSFRRRDA